MNSVITVSVILFDWVEVIQFAGYQISKTGMLFENNAVRNYVVSSYLVAG